MGLRLHHRVEDNLDGEEGDKESTRKVGSTAYTASYRVRNPNGEPNIELLCGCAVSHLKTKLRLTVNIYMGNDWLGLG